MGLTMTVEQGIEQLNGVLVRDAAGRYCFTCRKAFVMLRLLGCRDPLRFAARDRVAFRIDAVGLAVEELETGKVRERFGWGELETMAGGEQETESGGLFQG